MKQQNYFQILHNLEDSHFPVPQFCARVDADYFVINNPNSKFYGIKTRSSIDISSCLIDKFNEENITPKILQAFSDAALPNKENNQQSSDSESFYAIFNHAKILIYIESAVGNWYKQDFSSYNHQQTKELIGYLKESNVPEMDLFCRYCFFN